MAEPRSQRMQIVLMLAERHEQAAAQRLGNFREQVNAEQEQLRQLEEYAAHYLDTYGSLKTGLHAQDLISYSSFIQRLGDAKKEQQAKIARMMQVLDQLQQEWRDKHRRRESIQDLIARLRYEENDVLEKRLQKELDDLSAQQFQRQPRFHFVITASNTVSFPFARLSGKP